MSGTKVDERMVGVAGGVAADLAWEQAAPPDAVFVLRPGQIVEVSGPTGMGATRLGLHLLAAPSARYPVAAIDVKGWLSPLAAWEVGVDPDRLVVVRCSDDSKWPQVAAALMDGIGAIYAEVPDSVGHHDLRRLWALARARRTGVVFRPLGEGLPAGVANLRLRAVGVKWSGVGQGHGRLLERRVELEASGKGVAGITRDMEMVDDGSDVVRFIPRSGLVVGGETRAAG